MSPLLLRSSHAALRAPFSFCRRFFPPRVPAVGSLNRIGSPAASGDDVDRQVPRGSAELHAVLRRPRPARPLPHGCSGCPLYLSRGTATQIAIPVAVAARGTSQRALRPAAPPRIRAPASAKSCAQTRRESPDNRGSQRGAPELRRAGPLRVKPSSQAASISASGHGPNCAPRRGVRKESFSRRSTDWSRGDSAAHDDFLSGVERSGAASLARSADRKHVRKVHEPGRPRSQPRSTGRPGASFKPAAVRSSRSTSRRSVLRVRARFRDAVASCSPSQAARLAQASTPGHNSSPGAIDRASRVLATASPSARWISVR